MRSHSAVLTPHVARAPAPARGSGGPTAHVGSEERGWQDSDAPSWRGAQAPMTSPTWPGPLCGM